MEESDVDFFEYELIHSSEPERVSLRGRKLTWSEYFHKKYMVFIIMCVSIVIYIYVSYRSRDDTSKKL